ncbi:MAG: hypothetical protein QN183_05735 [Armatimonadota bacterium]|nr:hypothetical protein [Armatimonadota bacterium]MDR7534703.1 hypothetical protein [Armatimonadota bacterium]MDR7535848.1 hypothetical protein [Armatimonadota bacterium]
MTESAAVQPILDWPGRAKLAARLREILRREFGADDAWVVHAGDRCRLEARVGWRVVVLLEGHARTFWAPFYVEEARRRFRQGRRPPVRLTQRGRRELLEMLRVLWAERVGAPRRPPLAPAPLAPEA